MGQGSAAQHAPRSRRRCVWLSRPETLIRRPVRTAALVRVITPLAMPRKPGITGSRPWNGTPSSRHPKPIRSGQGSPCCWSVVLHQTELVSLRVGHDNDDALVVVVSLPREPSAQRGDELDGLAEVVNSDVDMDSDLAHLRLGNRLEHQPRLRIAAMPEVDPAVLRRPRLPTEQRTPEARHSLRVNAVDRHTRHKVRHRHNSRAIGTGTAPRAHLTCKGPDELIVARRPTWTLYAP